MSDTPRQRTGGFPGTPGTAAPSRRRVPLSPPDSSPPSATSQRSDRRASSLPLAPESAPRPAANQPLIPLTFLDGPQQRFYAAAAYVFLWGWKLFDYVRLVENDGSSVGLFLKWVLLDMIFLVGLPELRIPWLELSQSTAWTLWAVHSFFNWLLMFNIGIPLQPWLIGFLKVFYDREISVSEQSVKVSSILHNHSLIMGRQIINILPEGSAILNFEHTPFCLSQPGRDTVKIPIQFNATIPAEIELIRIDLDTDNEEIIKVPNKEIKKIVKNIKELLADSGSSAVQTVEYPVKKTGIYRLGKVLDEYKLEVQRTTKDTYVVPCPQAKFRASGATDRCFRDLSDLFVDVTGTPPLKIKYSRTINKKDQSFHFQSLQPEDYSSPLLGSPSSSMVLASDGDHSWVKPRAVEVRLNETLGSPGDWEYAVDEVQDGFGNIQKYADSTDDVDYPPRPKHLMHEFKVKERPRARLQGCDLRNPLKVAKGKSLNLPISFSMSGNAPDDTSHALTWEFSPIDSLTDSGEHGDRMSIESYRARNSHDRPTISAPGLYTLKSVSSASCEGEIQEPSSCLLLNPLEPSLTLRAEEIPDKCAGKSIGLRVDLDLTGTPPFNIHYTVSHKETVRSEMVRVNGLRHQIELRPREAGLHRYIFTRIDDDIYKNLPLAGLALEQDVKPPAGAFIQHASGKQSACLEQQVEVDVLLLGDAPFTLEWEMIHDGKRKSERVAGIENPNYTIKTPPLNKGGDHILALNSVTDRSGCRVFLQDELKIAVRRQRPRASFGLVENKRNVMAVENAKVNLPLRLQGEAPWTISYRNSETGKTLQKIAHNGNDFLPIQSKGVFEIINVVDKQCPGSVDPQGSQFSVDWFPRPDISLVPAEGISAGQSGFVKRDVCEGDIDGFEVNLQGSAPYHVEYEITHKSFQRASSPRRIIKNFDAALNRAAIPLDTADAGDYTYTFSTLADNLYDSGKSKDPLVVRQRVNAKPSASFVKPGQSFKYCKLEQDNEDNIPITLSGVAPFYVELEIKHHGATVPETYRIQSIKSNSHNIQIPRQHLHLGAQHVRIREVRDARGCQRRYDLNAPSVQVHLYEAPAMYPLESRRDYCVGERIAYTLSGTPPFEVWYDFQGQQRKAKSATTSFRRIAETPGDFTITSISDKASECRASVEITKSIHPLPAVKISKGRQTRVDIHEGNEVEILFEFWGTPPFEFTYTRSSNAKKGQKSVVLETRHDVSYDSSKIVKASQEGTYEVVAIKDKFCSFSTQQAVDDKDQKLLQY